MRSSYAPSAKETHRSISLVSCLKSNLTGCFKREVETTDRFHESCRCCVLATKMHQLHVIQFRYIRLQ